ncbi:hypothetical protein EYE42_07225 [Paracoccus subflavus]|uniref:Uncharacterized protein n=1 Tax=Paracoccus subflavus TaxID=2528244 RepID=A0A4V6MTD6_9RHOB|nr:hypothetical protein [Paracoccus subflavus]TBN41162.1 hypothetical protein EYE42_07225 [Paracoccus subflavus]
MTNEEAANLVKRVDELERSNKALWAWVKALANQDTMILEFFFRSEDRNEEAMLQSRNIVNHITDNAHYLHGISVEDTNE